MVRAAQKGEAKATSPEVARTAASIKIKDAKKFASTKHKGLPEKKMKKESVSEDAKMRRQSDEKLAAAHKKFSSMDQSPANSFMKKRIEKEINRRKKTVKEAAELKKAKINYKTTKKGGKTTYHVNKNDEADAQKAMKNDPKYILGKTRVKPVKEDKEAYHTMSTKEFNKTHRDFKSGSKKKGNARVTKGVTNPSGTTTPVSRRVKFSDEYIYELDLKKIGKKIVNKAKEVWNRPIMKDYPTKKQWTDAVKSGTSHQYEGAFTTGAALTAAGLAAWKFSQGMRARNQMKKSIDTPGTRLNNIKKATDQKNKLLQQLNQSHEPEGNVISEKPGDGYLGPTVGKIGIPNPIRIAKDAVDQTNRANLKKVNTINKISPGSASMPKFKQFNKDTSAAYKNLFQSYEPQGDVVEEGFYQKRYAGVGKGYETVGKNKRMDKSNKRSGDSKKQYRELHQDLAKIKKEETIVEKKKMVKIKVTRPIKTKVTDVGAGGKEYVRKDWSEENLTEIKFSFRKTSKPKTEKKPQKAQDAGARGRRLLQRREYARTISGSEDRVPDDLRDSVQYEESCGNGEYYCHDEQKCKPIPEGHKVEKGGNLVKETSVALKFGTSGTDLSIGGTSVRNTINNVKTGVNAIKNIKKDGLVKGIKNTFTKTKTEKPSIASNIDNAIKNFKKEDTQHLQNIKNAIKTKTMNGKPLTDKQIEGLKAGLTQGNWRQDGSKRGMEEGAAWTKKAGKNKSGGLNEKGRKSYERENPGSDLKAPSKKKGNKRRASFCARMSGMKKKLTSKKTANDPNSRINKSLRAWNCEYEPETPMLPEATRLKKEKGYDKGGTKKPTGGKNKDEALNAVLSNIRAKHGKGAIMRKGSNQQKKVKGQKSTSGTGKYLAKHKEKQQLKKDAKEMGYGKDTKGYVETRARYGSKENMKSGKGLGT